jgi:exodeoxyribonuclease VIII
VEIGFHQGLSSRDYHAIDAASSHRLGLLKKSPLHLKWSISNPTPPSEAMVIGEAIHTAILEPMRFAHEYIKGIKADGRTKEGKAAKEEFAKRAGLRTVLEPNIYNDIQNISIACQGHSLANALINAATEVEVSGFFKDPTTGIFCKMRADAMCENQKTIFDIKSTQDASPSEFEKSIFNFGYHRQAAFYIDGANILGKQIENYAIIAIEKVAPYAIAVYRLQNEAIELGRSENRGLLNLYAECVKNNNWPGYPEHFTDVGLPAWAKKQIERSING